MRTKGPSSGYSIPLPLGQPQNDHPNSQFLQSRQWTSSPFMVGVLSTLIIAFCLVQIFVIPRNAPHDSSHSLRAPPRDTDTLKDFCTFAIMCGTGDTDTVAEMRPLLISALLLSSCPLHFIFMTDEVSAGLVSKMFAENLPVSKKPLKVDIWTISTDWIDAWASHISLDPHGHHSGSWGTAKLIVPWLLKDLDRVVVIDTDMIFLDDPASLWKQFDDGASWAYKMPLFDRSAAHSICSCVVLMNIQVILEHKIYPDLFADVLHHRSAWYNETSKLYAPPMGDQGLYFALLKRYAHLIASLEDRFNVDHCHEYYGALEKSSTKMVSILHKNCDYRRSNLDGEAGNFFKFFSTYRWQWLRADRNTGYPVELNLIRHEGSQDGAV